MGKALTLILTFLTLALIPTACNTSGCTDNQNSLPYAGFYSSTTEKEMALNTLDIFGIGAPGDSLLYSSGETLSSIYLPFRSSTDKTSYVFHYTQEGLEDPANNDTLTFRYTSEPYFASEECGAMLRYTITGFSHTRHLIDSIAITDSLITNVDNERIKIYFRTSE